MSKSEKTREIVRLAVSYYTNGNITWDEVESVSKRLNINIAKFKKQLTNGGLK